MKVLFLFPYPLDESPSQRFRFEQYLGALGQQKITYHTQAFWDLQTWRILFRDGNYVKKIIGLIKGFIRRVSILRKVNRYDRVFVHRECTPVGPPFIEWIIARVLTKKIIYDFDDSIWLPNTSTENKIASLLKYHGKVKSICKWAYRVSCGNNYLADFARQHNRHVVVNPTTIDTLALHVPDSHQKKPINRSVVLGWTGTHSTLKYLYALLPVFERLHKSFPEMRLLIISNKPPSFTFSFMEHQFWNKSTEIDDLRRIDIGLMPLTDDPWSKGKCGFKALQFMALGIPTLASPVGVNETIVNHGTNGFICSTPEEWIASASKLIQNENLRMEMGTLARRKVEESYSVSSNRSNFLSLFE